MKKTAVFLHSSGRGFNDFQTEGISPPPLTERIQPYPTLLKATPAL